MVQIESSAPGPVLSARSVYNLLEGKMKQPSDKFQPPIKETLRKLDKIKKVKKEVKRLKRKKKKLVEAKICKDKILIKMKSDVKPKKKEANKKKKTTENKSQIEGNSENGKDIKETVMKNKVMEDQIKPLTKHIQSDNSHSENLTKISNSLEKNKDLEISEEPTEEHIIASEILKRIESLKRKYFDPELELMETDVKISEKETPEIRKTRPIIEYKEENKVTNNVNSDKDVKISKMKEAPIKHNSKTLLIYKDEVTNDVNSDKDVKINKMKKTKKGNDSMLLLVYKDEVTNGKSATKNSKKNLANGKTKRKNVSELKTFKKTSSTITKHFHETNDVNSDKDVKINKMKKNPKENDSVPLLVHKDEVTNDEKATKNSKKNLSNGKIKRKNVSKLKTFKKTSTITKNFGESFNENTSNHNAATNNENSSEEKTQGKKAKKRKLEDLKKINMEKNIELSEKALQLVSSKNNLLTNFLTRDSYEVEDSQLLGENVFASIISPLTTKEFMKNYWEKSHLLIRAGDKNRFKSILSTEDIDNILRTNNLSYTKNIDITSYVEGKRDTHNPEGRALASVVWDYYNSGCSIRMLNPQTFSSSVWKLLSTLQEFFNSFCGANVYLTPPGTQGFAPHWDDIEAFILQLEGKKRWKVYKWRSEKETLPRDSSGNFGLQDQLGELLLDCVLEPGDLLYFPRGYIHQAEALEDIHSLHITISTYQKNAWVDLLEKLLPTALENAAEKHVEFRQGLPVDYMYNSGIAYFDQKTESKHLIKKKILELVNKMIEDDAPIDAAIDQLAKGSVYDALPPFLTKNEKQRTVFEGGERWCGKSEGIVNKNELTPETPIRLLRRGCVRLLVEEDSVRLFHSLENSREYHEEEPKFIEISPEIAPGVEKLIHSYPKYINIEDLPLDSLEDKMILATGLWEKGIIISEHKLEPSDIEEEISTSPEIKE